MEPPPDVWVLLPDWSGAHPPTPGKPFPADIGKNPFTGVFVLLPPERNPVMRGIILWLLGVPLVVIVGLPT
jgi:hypothetical protein